MKGLIAKPTTWVIIALVGVIAYAVLVYIPSQKGAVDVSLGYVLADGTEVPLNGNASQMLFMDPSTLAWYTSSAKTTRVTGVYGTLVVNPVTDLDVQTINIEWTREVWGTATSGSSVEMRLSQFDQSGSFGVSPNTTTTINQSKVTVGESTFGTPTYDTPVIFRVRYTVTATAGASSATATAEGTITIYYTPGGTLTLSASVNTGYLQLV